MAKALAKGSRITGAQRDALAGQYAKRYAAGDSIRKIADDGGRSFGFVHGVLKESRVALRGRGGATRGARAGTRHEEVGRQDGRGQEVVHGATGEEVDRQDRGREDDHQVGGGQEDHRQEGARPRRSAPASSPATKAVKKAADDAAKAAKTAVKKATKAASEVGEDRRARQEVHRPSQASAKKAPAKKTAAKKSTKKAAAKKS